MKAIEKLQSRLKKLYREQADQAMRKLIKHVNTTYSDPWVRLYYLANTSLSDFDDGRYDSRIRSVLGSIAQQRLEDLQADRSSGCASIFHDGLIARQREIIRQLMS